MQAPLSTSSSPIGASRMEHNERQHMDLEQGETLVTGDTLMDERLSAAVRHGFVRKVFSLVGAQLLFTALVAAPFTLHAEEARLFFKAHTGLLHFISLFPLVLVCVLSCNPRLGREYPTNYAILGGVTLGMSFLVGFICTAYTAYSVLYAALMTAGVVLGLRVFAMQTKYDFSSWLPYMFTFFVVLFFAGIALMFLPYSRPIEILYCSAGAFLFSVYIIIDLQMIVGGKHVSHQFTVDEYVFAALVLYLDIINLFIKLLRLFGERR